MLIARNDIAATPMVKTLSLHNGLRCIVIEIGNLTLYPKGYDAECQANTRRFAQALLDAADAMDLSTATDDAIPASANRGDAVTVAL